MEVFVDDHPVVELEAGLVSQFHVRNDADADAHEVAGEFLPRSDDDGGGPVVASNLGGYLVGVERDAFLRAVVLEEPGEGRISEPSPDMGLGLDDGDANASLGQGRRDLHPDESGTDENRSLPLGRFGRDGVGVVESAEVVHARQVTAGELETNGPTPGGNEGFLESNGLAVGEDGGLVVEIQPLHGAAENETDVLVVEILLGVEEELVPPLLATQELFGKRGAAIRVSRRLARPPYGPVAVVCG